MIVYADILITINTLVNYFMLLAVKKFSRSYSSRWRIALGAFVGGISSLLIFADKLGIFMTILKILSGFLMVYVSFKFVSFKEYFKRCFWLFSICFLIGGFMFFMCLIMKKDAFIYNNGIIYFDINMTFLIVCTVVSYGILTLAAHLSNKKAPKSKEYYVTIQKGGEIYSATGLMDTGNNLSEPFSALPVVMVDKVVFNKFSKRIENEKIRYIPLQTVSGETVVKAFKPDSLTIGKLNTNKVYIGESPGETGEYKIILNINLEGEIHNAET